MYALIQSLESKQVFENFSIETRENFGRIPDAINETLKCMDLTKKSGVKRIIIKENNKINAKIKREA